MYVWSLTLHTAGVMLSWRKAESVELFVGVDTEVHRKPDAG